MKLISYTCPNCRAHLSIDPERTAFCQYCGTQFFIDDGTKRSEHTQNINVNQTNRQIDEARIKELELLIKKLEYKERREKNDRKFIKVFFPIFFAGLALIILLGTLTDRKSPEEEALEQERIQASIDSGMICAGNFLSFKGENYKVVLAQLSGLGFTNIELVDLNDADKDSWIKRHSSNYKEEDTVESVSIQGNTMFFENDYFDPDSPIVILYH